MPSVAELGAKVRAKYPGQYDDLDDATLGSRVKAKYPGSYDDFEDAFQAPAQQAQSPLDTRLPGMPVSFNQASGLLNAAAGFLPGPAGVGLSALTGGGLEGVRQAALGERMNPAAIGGQAAKQAAYTLAGKGLGKGIARVAEPFSKKATSYLAARAEDIVQSSQTLIPTQAVLRRMGPIYNEAATLGARASKNAYEAVDDFLRTKGTRLTMKELHDIRQVADQRARHFADIGKDLVAKRWRAIANESRDILNKELPEYAAINRRLSGNIRARDVVTGGVGRTAARVGAGATVGAAAGALSGDRAPWYVTSGLGALAALGISNPQLMNALANMMLSQGAQQGLRQLPRAAGTAAGL